MGPWSVICRPALEVHGDVELSLRQTCHVACHVWCEQCSSDLRYDLRSRFKITWVILIFELYHFLQVIFDRDLRCTPSKSPPPGENPTVKCIPRRFLPFQRLYLLSTWV